MSRQIVRNGQRDPLDVLFNTLADEQSNGRVHAAMKLLRKMLDDENVDTRVRAAQTLIMFSQPPKPYRLKSEPTKPQ